MPANLHQDLAKSRGRAARHVVLRFPRGKTRTAQGLRAERGDVRRPHE
jgi:hypothetical protein